MGVGSRGLVMRRTRARGSQGGGGGQLDLPRLEKTERVAVLRQQTRLLRVRQVKRGEDKNVNYGRFPLKSNITIDPVFYSKLLHFFSVFE